MRENNNKIQKEIKNLVNIKVIGVGGGGNNTVHSMVKEQIKGVEFIVANTDEQVLNTSIADTILPLGEKTAKGLGAGADPKIGRQSALESEELIKETIEGADMVIIAAGMGGGTGTGAAPEIARISREMGALTVGVVTTPFTFEGSQRKKNSDMGLENIKKTTDSLIVVSNDKLLQQFGGISFKDSFMYADAVVKHTIRTITDLIVVPSLINLDFADVTSVMKDKGSALIGIGKAKGEDRSIKAAVHAISSPILETSIKGASHAIINISGSDVKLEEAQKATETIKEATGNDLIIIFGISVNEKLGENIEVSVIATGLSSNNVEELTEEEIKEEISKTIETLNIKFENEKTKEILVENPLPEEEKMTITEEVELQNTPFDISDDEDDDNDLPAFLKS